MNSFPLGGLEETTRTLSYYVDEDYSAKREIWKPLHERSNHCGSESSTLDTDVYLQCCVLLVVHATKEEVKYSIIHDGMCLCWPAHWVSVSSSLIDRCVQG